jgi:signal transduction histidine kinase
MAMLPDWETVPFHFIWVSLTVLYGFRVWKTRPTLAVLAFVMASTGFFIALEYRRGYQPLDELTEVPLMAAMFIAMVWHARRRQQALLVAEELADERASLLQQQQRFLHDASHELRTPVTIARGHLEVFAAEPGPPADVSVALDELNRMERIIERLLRLASSDQPDFIVPEPIEIESFLEDVFLRWAEVVGPAPHEAWLTTRDLADADEAFISSSVAGILPVTRFEDASIGDGRPGTWTMRARADREAFIRGTDTAG